jgi:hypothetical protein
MMALAAAGRTQAAERMLSVLKSNEQKVVREVAAPVCEAVIAHRRGEHGRVVELMAPRLEEMRYLGGSHAQQDVLLQLYRDSAAKAAALS